MNQSCERRHVPKCKAGQIKQPCFQSRNKTVEVLRIKFSFILLPHCKCKKVYELFVSAEHARIQEENVCQVPCTRIISHSVITIFYPGLSPKCLQEHGQESACVACAYSTMSSSSQQVPAGLTWYPIVLNYIKQGSSLYQCSCPELPRVYTMYYQISEEHCDNCTSLYIYAINW